MIPNLMGRPFEVISFFIILSSSSKTGFLMILIVGRKECAMRGVRSLPYLFQ